MSKKGKRRRGVVQLPVPTTNGNTSSVLPATYYAANAAHCLKSGFFRRFTEAGMTLETQKMKYVIEKLQAAQKFRIPDGGRLLEGEAQLKFQADVCDALRMPYPVTILEYSEALEEEGVQNGAQPRPTRHITLVLDIPPDGSDSPIVDQLTAGVPGFHEHGGLIVVPLWTSENPLERLHDAPGKRGHDLQWLVGNTCAVISRRQSFLSCSLGQECAAGAIRFERVALFPFVEAVTDVSEDVLVTLQFLLALSCANVVPALAEDAGNPSTRSRKRRPNQRTPHNAYWELRLIPASDIDQLPRQDAPGTTRNSPRMHLRRGHWRTLMSGRRAWVNSTTVGRKDDGEVHKDYVVES